jgi:hypothetical protein
VGGGRTGRAQLWPREDDGRYARGEAWMAVGWAGTWLARGWGRRPDGPGRQRPDSFYWASRWPERGGQRASLHCICMPGGFSLLSCCAHGAWPHGAVVYLWLWLMALPLAQHERGRDKTVARCLNPIRARRQGALSSPSAVCRSTTSSISGDDGV